MTLYCGDPFAAEDFAQEALARACKAWRKVSALESPEGWVHRVAMNLAHSWYRRLRRAQPPATAPLSVVPTEDALALRAAVSRLPRRQREALVLRFYLDWSVARTSAAMGIAEGTVRALTSQAVSALQETLGREWEEAGDA